MLRIKLVYGVHEWNYENNSLHYKDQLQEKVNAAIEDLEAKGLRVRDVRFQFGNVTDKTGCARNPVGVAVIYYDDSVCYCDNPEEIDDLYHRKKMLENSDLEGIFE